MAQSFSISSQSKSYARAKIIVCCNCHEDKNGNRDASTCLRACLRAPYQGAVLQIKRAFRVILVSSALQ